MRKTLGLVSVLALMAGLAASATGPQGTVRQAFSPISGANAAGVEHQSAINATVGNYAVIAPTFYSPGQNSPNSYIRFFNGAGLAGSTTTSTFSITIVGNQSGSRYGNAFNLAIPHMASIQYDIAELVGRTGAVPGTFTGGDTSYVVYVQNSDKEAGYMHAVYDWASSLFENMSMCATGINEQMSSLHNELVLTNIHTSVGTNHIGQNFPSTIRVHNYYNVPITYTLTVFNAGTQTNGGMTANAGTQICQLSGQTIQPNTTMSLPVSTLEANAACTALISSADYLNVVISDSGGGSPNAVPSHTIFVSRYNGNTSMTPTCAVNAVSASSSTGGGVIISPY